MITNAIPILEHAAPLVQPTLTAWNAVALGAGMFLVGIYNHIVAAGGIKNICKNLWGGNSK